MKKSNILRLAVSIIMILAITLAPACSTPTPPAATTPVDNATEPTTASPPVTPINNLTDAQIAARKVAEDFIRNSSTFRFKGRNIMVKAGIFTLRLRLG